MGPAAVAAKPRGRPRDPGRDRAILDATLDLLVEEGYARLSIEAVAQRAGVGKPTLYRRWPSKAALVIDALHAAQREAKVPDGETVRDRLIALLTDLISNVRRQRTRQLMAGLIGELPRDPELAAAMREVFLAKRRRVLFRIFDEAIAADELPAGLDHELAADMLVAPILLRALLTGGRLPASLSSTIVDAFLAGVDVIGPDPSGRRSSSSVPFCG
jgi:AcrR family transcriptional regulator